MRVLNPNLKRQECFQGVITCRMGPGEEQGEEKSALVGVGREPGGAGDRAGGPEGRIEEADFAQGQKEATDHPEQGLA